MTLPNDTVSDGSAVEEEWLPVEPPIRWEVSRYYWRPSRSINKAILMGLGALIAIAIAFFAIVYGSFLYYSGHQS